MVSSAQKILLKDMIAPACSASYTLSVTIGTIGGHAHFQRQHMMCSTSRQKGVIHIFFVTMRKIANGTGRTSITVIRPSKCTIWPLFHKSRIDILDFYSDRCRRAIRQKLCSVRDLYFMIHFEESCESNSLHILQFGTRKDSSKLT